MENRMKGIGASPGIAIGNVLLKKEPRINIVKKDITNIKEEIERLRSAIDESRQQIQKLLEYTHDNIGEKEAGIFEAHLMILDDPNVFGQAEQKILGDQVNAEWAIKEVREVFIEIFNSMENEYLRERLADLKDVTDRVLGILLGLKVTDLSRLTKKVILVGDDLTPSDTSQLDKTKVLGFITEKGGRTSHAAIMARTLEIPAIVGAVDILNKIKDDDLVIFDGDNGTIVINPDEDTLESYRAKQEDFHSFRKKLLNVKGEKSETQDGFQVEIVANIGTPKDVESVIGNDGEGVGLFRTEFLYMDRDTLPTEEEQFEAYRDVAVRLKDKPIVIRTLDIGGDKDLPYLGLNMEINPFLGYRAIRFCLDRPDIFKVQLRALLRASAYGNIKVMFPMISSIGEVRQVKRVLEEVKDDLKRHGVAFNKDIEIGIMVEIPAAAIQSDLFAKEVDFFSIGTNDLIQYITAVDRGNEKIAHLYNPFHPALLRMIKIIIENGHKEGIWVGMCGEAAGDPKLIPILIGMGLDEFSMSPLSILRARCIIRNLKKEDMKKIVEKVINLPTAEEVEQFIDDNIKIMDGNW